MWRENYTGAERDILADSCEQCNCSSEFTKGRTFFGGRVLLTKKKLLHEIS
jgi:hypothetical protein